MAESEIATPLSTKLSQLRAESGLSYQYLSQRSCVDVAYLHRLETGRALRPGRDILIRIGIGLGLNVAGVDELVTLAGHWPLLRDLRQGKDQLNGQRSSESLPSVHDTVATAGSA